MYPSLYQLEARALRFSREEFEMDDDVWNEFIEQQGIENQRLCVVNRDEEIHLVHARMHRDAYVGVNFVEGWHQEERETSIRRERNDFNLER